MKENNAAYNESGKLMKNIMVPYQTMSIDEIKEDAWGWCAKLVDGAMAQGQGPQSYVPLMLSAARLGLGVRSSLSAEEKDLVILVFGQLLNMTHEELFAIFCNNKETDYSRMLEGVSRLGNTIAIPFLHLTLCFAYADGKIEKELPQQLEQAFGTNLVADFFQSGQESVPDPPAVLNDLERQIVSWFLEDNTLHSLTDIQRKFASESSETVKQTLDALCEKDILFGGENIAGNFYGLVDDDITIQAPAEPELEISDEDHEKLVQISNMLDALENMMETMGTESDPTPEAVKETELEFRFPESNRLTTERYSLIIPEGFTVNRNVDGRAFWAWLPDKLDPKDSVDAPILLMEGMFMPDLSGGSTSVQERVESGITGLRLISSLTGMDIDEPEEFHSGDIHGFIGATENIHYIGTVLLPEGNQQIRVQANSEQYQGDAARNLLIEVLKTVQIAGKPNSTSGSEWRATGNTSPSSERRKTEPKSSDPQLMQQEIIDYLGNYPNSTCAAIADYMELSLHATTGILTTLRKSGKVCRGYLGKAPVYSLGVDEMYYPDGFVPKDESISKSQKDKDSLQETDTTVSHVFCSNCGAKMESNYKFCSRCGAPLVGAQRNMQAVFQPITFHPKLLSGWELHHDKIVTRTKVIPLSSVTAIRQHIVPKNFLENGVIQVDYKGSFLCATLAYAYGERESGEIAVKYIREQAGLPQK